MARHATRSTKTLGDKAEQLAFRYLLQQGLRPVTRNFRCRSGEIDLIMLDDACLVFVEVRYRSANRFVPARITVDRHKQTKLVRAAAMYLASHRNYARHTVRFDVIGTDQDSYGELTIDWTRDAFRPTDSNL